MQDQLEYGMQETLFSNCQIIDGILYITRKIKYYKVIERDCRVDYLMR